ncbi:MAG: L-ectoine synthase [Gammaproteobacteria bacterium RIFCSPLOWO2_02_FULL_57_10]|nr:MAG: L-ectoine synthase [Gammaproteobacteria bacterium RIFCSPLOWO2_02_FULL_57_10]
MIVRTLKDCENSQRCVRAENWKSVRMLLAEDNMGFSFHITTIYANTETRMHYQQHLESVYCISGNGQIHSLEDDKVYKVLPGTLYILDKHDRHVLTAEQDLILACVFNPPLLGTEVHDAEGSYPLAPA